MSGAFVLLALLLSGAGPAVPATACRLVADWDTERDLVVYETRRGACLTPAPAITGRDEARRRKSLFELRRISNGSLVETADCEISFSISGEESPCDLAELRRRRPGSFGRLRSGKRGSAIEFQDGNPEGVPKPSRDGTGRAKLARSPREFTAARIGLPAPGAPAFLDLAALGARLTAVTKTPRHVFATLAHGHFETLLRLPAGVPETQVRRRQQDLLAQAAVYADVNLLDAGRPLVAAARAHGPLDVAAVSAAFCRLPDVPWRLETWRAAAKALDAQERRDLEAELAKRGCFAGVTPATYDAAGPAMAAARAWIDASARADSDALRALSGFPLALKGLWDHVEPADVAACGGRVDRPVRWPESTLDVLDPPGLEKALPCLRAPGVFEDLRPVPPLRDGRWPPNRGDAFEGTVATTLPADGKTLSPTIRRRYGRALETLAPDGTLVQAVLTDNDGVTATFLVHVVPTDDGGSWRVRAVFAEWRFDE